MVLNSWALIRRQKITERRNHRLADTNYVNHNSKLTVEQVREIHWAWARHIRPTQTAMAKYYGVPQQIISRVCNNKSYQNVTGEPKNKYIQY